MESNFPKYERDIFKDLKSLLKTDIIKVIELRSGIPGSEVKAGIRFIHENLSDR